MVSGGLGLHGLIAGDSAARLPVMPAFDSEAGHDSSPFAHFASKGAQLRLMGGHPSPLPSPILGAAASSSSAQAPPPDGPPDARHGGGHGGRLGR